jgi:dTMP kinase
MLGEVQDPGLIAFEGSDGAGKTTQRRLLATWLEDMNQGVAVTKWNSSPLLKPLIKARKAGRTLDPVEYAILHAADFRHRYETVIQPVSRPDIVFYFSAAIETCVERIMATRKIKFYESGQDVTGLDDPLESYLQFAPRVVQEYERLAREFSFITVDAEKPVHEQHRFIRETFEERLCYRPPKPLLNACYSQVDV